MSSQEPNRFELVGKDDRWDNSLAILALLERKKRDDVARAMVLGDSFLYAQAHDPTYSDGRVRQAYWVGPFTLSYAHNDAYFVRPDGKVNLVGAPWFFQGSSVSDMCWVGIALARLYARTRMDRYLEGALRLGQWIVDNAFDTAGLGGYSFGVDAMNKRLNQTKLTEHNVDVYGFFSNLLAPLTGDANWISRGQHALDFIERLWNAEGSFFYTGSNDGTTIDTSVVLEEVQSEAYLALLDDRYEEALDWAKTNLIATDTPQSLNSSLTGNLRLSGMTFSDVSRRATERANAHGTDFFFDKYPTFAIGVADVYPPGDEGWGRRPLEPVPGDPEFSWHVAQSLVTESEFDMTVCQELAVDHGLLTPLPLLWTNEPEWNIRVVPLVVNVVQHPLPTARRLWKLGRALRKAVESYPEEMRVAVLGTGGLSHQLHGERFGFRNEEWDREFMARIVEDPEGLAELSHHEYMLHGGAEAVEMIMWLGMRGALSPNVKVIHQNYYAPMLTGMGLLVLEDSG